MMKYLLLLSAFLICESTIISAAPPEQTKAAIRKSPTGNMHPKAQIDFVKKKVKAREQPYYDAYLQLMNYADSASNHPVHSLADFSVPGYYVDPVNHRKNSLSLQSDAFDAYACALACQLSGNEKYAKEALRFLQSWADINKKYSAPDGPLVMSYSGTAMIIAAELLNNYKGWKAAEKQQFAGWATNVYRKAANEIRNRKNNWADWGRLGSVLVADYLQDTTEMNENIRLIKSDLFEKIAEDGHMPEETRRGNNGIWYTYFSLAPITAASWVIYNATGDNIFEMKEGEKSIKKAVDYLFYYNQHPDEWTYFKGPNQGSPSKWPGNLLEVLSGVYHEPKYSAYVESARPLIYNLHHFAWTFPTLMKVQLEGYDGSKK